MKNRNAVSMIEVMIGVFLLSLMLLPSLNAIIGKTQAVTATRDHSQAALIAQNLIETCRAYSFALIEADQYEASNPEREKTFEWQLLNSPTLNTIEMNGITYTVDSANTYIDAVKYNSNTGNMPPSVYLFKLTLNYTGKDRKNHTLSLSTAISQRE